jgi:hypothetical protein
MLDTFADASRPPEAAIEIRLSRPQQLFNSLDPSPFHERDLDEDAEAYIVDGADPLIARSQSLGCSVSRPMVRPPNVGASVDPITDRA